MQWAHWEFEQFEHEDLLGHMNERTLRSSQDHVNEMSTLEAQAEANLATATLNGHSFLSVASH